MKILTVERARLEDDGGDTLVHQLDKLRASRKVQMAAIMAKFGG